MVSVFGYANGGVGDVLLLFCPKFDARSAPRTTPETNAETAVHSLFLKTGSAELRLTFHESRAGSFAIPLAAPFHAFTRSGRSAPSESCRTVPAKRQWLRDMRC